MMGENLLLRLNLWILRTSEEELRHVVLQAIPLKEDYKILNSEIRKLGYNIPPLVNEYMSLSPTMRMFGTATNMSLVSGRDRYP